VIDVFFYKLKLRGSKMSKKEFCCKKCNRKSAKTYLSKNTARDNECLVAECKKCGVRHYADSGDVVDHHYSTTVGVGIIVESQNVSPANFSVPKSHQYGEMSIGIVVDGSLKRGGPALSPTPYLKTKKM